MKSIKSRTRYVNFLLMFRLLVIKTWSLTPKFLSKIILNILRNGTSIFSFGLRYIALFRLAKSCGEKVIVFPGVYLKNIHNLEIGTNVSIHEMSYIDAYGGVKIGNDVAISHGVSIISFDHDIYLGYKNFKDAPAVIGQIIIKNNVWIGAGVKILKGVIIQKNCVLAAGSLINKSCKENSIMGGIPGICLKKLIQE
jgi:acetyltransferase-like isoleucine patch superfamily enzyme